jgi:hypothetical protein
LFRFDSGRADWRASTGAALCGAGLGLALGAVFLASGMGREAIAYAHARDVAVAAAAGYAGEMDQPADLGQAVYRLTHPEAVRADATARIGAARTRELDCLAEAVYYEARSESARGQAAVAQVVMNRVKKPGFPKTVCGVVFQGARHPGCQFSFACDGSMHASLEAQAWDRARHVAARALAGVALAEVGSATHFHTTDVSPGWTVEMRRVAQVGAHVFYRFSPAKAAAARAAAASEEHAILTSGPGPGAQLRLMPALIDKTADGPTPTPPTALPETKGAPSPAPAAKPAETAGLKSPQPVSEAAS